MPETQMDSDNSNREGRPVKRKSSSGNQHSVLLEQIHFQIMNMRQQQFIIENNQSFFTSDIRKMKTKFQGLSQFLMKLGDRDIQDNLAQINQNL